MGRSYSNILMYLTRLRQLACSPTLCPPEFIEDCRNSLLVRDQDPEPIDVPIIDPELEAELRAKLYENKDEECSVCFENWKLPEARITLW